MALTTQTGIDATENRIFSDVRPGSNKVLPNGQVLSEDAQILMDKSIIAKPLGVPAAEGIKIKNMAFKYRWVARLSSGGSMYARRKAQGWTDATIEDAEPNSVELTNDGGRLLYGDLILMKIPLQRYQEAMKYTMQRGLQLQRDTQYLTNSKGETPSVDVRADENIVRHKPEQNKQIQTFTPSQAELDAKMGPDRHKEK
jgi:hypothetical protein